MDPIEQLFGSAVRGKLLKLFLMNPGSRFSIADIMRQAGLRAQQLQSELNLLVRLKVVEDGVLRLKEIVESPRGTRASVKSRRRPGVIKVYGANKDFSLFSELRNLIVKSAPHAKGQLLGKIRRLGNIKLAILAGVFIDYPASRIDLLLVGEGFRKARMKIFIQWLEREVGKELNYVAMSAQEFQYRMEMYDRFIREVLELPHETLINRLGV